MRFLVTGGRDFGIENDEWDFIYNTLSTIMTYKRYDYLLLINGAAKGADEASTEWAKMNDIPYVEYPADWERYGKSAGYIRNKQMLDEAKPDWVIAFPGNTGTNMMCRLAENAGVRVTRYDYDPESFII